jgi:hypothetical protein
MHIESTRARRPGALTFIVPVLAGCFLAACNDSGATRATNPNAVSTQGSTASQQGRATGKTEAEEKVEVEIFAPEDGDHAGRDGVGWFIDIAVVFPPGHIEKTGFVGNQLTGPDAHNNVAPFPGLFAAGKDDKFGGLVVTLSTTTIGALSCQNLAGLFNLTGPTNVSSEETEIWDTWIITAPNFGVSTPSTMHIAEVADLNHDGILNDAPDVIPDVNGDGHCSAVDIGALGLVSDVYKKEFFIR